MGGEEAGPPCWLDRISQPPSPGLRLCHSLGLEFPAWQTPTHPQSPNTKAPPHTSHPPAAFGAAGPYTCILFTRSSGNLFNLLERDPEVFLKMV